MPKGMGYGGGGVMGGKGAFKGVKGGTTSSGQTNKHGVPYNMPQPLVRGGNPGASNLKGSTNYKSTSPGNKPSPGRGHGA